MKRINNSPFPYRTFLWVTVFSIAMGYLESAVVVYLREILYPAGFNFPLVPMKIHLAVTELFRELATLLMLAGVGYMAGRTHTERFAWFLFSFAIWDIFYYVFLKALLNWPESLLTWDILFLIPVTWTGPVITPAMISCLMIFLAIQIVRYTGYNRITKLLPFEWMLLIAGASVVFISFIWDYSSFILSHFSLRELWSLPKQQTLFDLTVQYIPVKFPWAVFISGAGIIFGAIVLFTYRNSRKNFRIHH